MTIQDKEKLFFRLFMQHQRSIFCYILMNIRKSEDAKDLMQEAAVIMWQKFSDEAPEEKFLWWGIAIARNLIKQHFQKLKRNHLVFSDQLIADIEDRSQTQVDGYEQHIGALRKCLSRLSDQQRLMLKLKYERGLKVKEIAAHVQRTAEAIYKMIARTQSALQQCIAKTMNHQRPEF